MNMFRKTFVLGLAALGLATAGLANAGDDADASAALTAPSVAPMPSMPPMPPMPMMQGMKHIDPAKMAELMAAAKAAKMARLHAKLKLAANQEFDWKTFTDALNAISRPGHINHEEMSKLTAPEREQKMLDVLKAAEVGMSARLAAVTKFYGTLSAEQKKVFDANFGPGHRIKHHGHGH